MHIQTLSYKSDNTECNGFFAYDSKSSAKRPCILIAHAWMGQDDFVRNKAMAFAELGYVGFAIDLYGNGKEAKDTQEAASLMSPLFQNRKLLQTRLKAAYDFAMAHPMVDPSKIGGIGFCFGGLSIIELLRSGVDVKGVVSFHAVLGNELHGMKANTVLIAKGIKGSLLILHGYNDPLVSQNDLLEIQKEMNDAKVDWQLYVYGHTAHAFTNPDADDEKSGLKFNQQTNDRAWTACFEFFDEIF